MKQFGLVLLFLTSSAFGAASIQMTAVTVAADGQTITVNTNCSTACMPSSGITGFSFTATLGGHNVAPNIVSATASGATITLITSAPLYRSAEVTTTINLATVGGGSNLTDGGSNTPTGQSSFATTNNSEWYSAGGAAFMGACQLDNGIVVLNNYPQTIHFQQFDGKVRCNLNITGINVFAFKYGADYVLNQDSQPLADFGTFDTATAYSTATYLTGMSGLHTYDIAEVYGSGLTGIPAGGDIEIVAVRVTGTLGGKPTAKWPMVAECGDSLVALGGADHIIDTRNGHLWLSSYGQGVADMGLGSSGAKVSGAGGIATFCPTGMLNFGQNPAIDYLEGGGNDLEVSVDIPTYTAAWDTYITGMQANGVPANHYVVEGILLASNFYPDSSIPAYDAVNQSEAAKYGLCFASRINWIGGTQDRQTTDHIHLNAAGELLLANHFIPITAGYVLGQSYSLSGPTAGAFGVPSTNFTVTRASGTWASGISASSETITLSDGGAGGIFTASGVLMTSGTNPMTVTPMTNDPAHISFTFTYTPQGLGGNKTITTTNGQQCWTDPPALTYQVAGGPNAILSGASKFSGTGVIQ